jgi:RHS repeat-associated protein
MRTCARLPIDSGTRGSDLCLEGYRVRPAACQGRLLRTLMALGVFFVVCCAFCPSSARAQNLLGDADGNGVVDLNDAKTIALYLAHQIPAIPNPANADVTQDGVVDLQDAFAIAQRVTGKTAFVVAAPRYGIPGSLQVGILVRAQVFEKFGPFHVTGATVRIQSPTAGFDSGNQAMVFDRDGRSLYYDWSTTGLTSANDYGIAVTLNESTGGGHQPDPLTVALNPKLYEPPIRVQMVDASRPGPGIPLVFRRIMPHSSTFYPYCGPFGYGWVHNYDLSLEEYTNGTVVFHGPEGYNRFFTPVAGGTYSCASGDYGVLTRDPNGIFQIREENGFIYRFLTNLRLDFVQDLHGNTIKMTYDGDNHLVQIQHSCGNSFTLHYNSNGLIDTLTDDLGRVTTYQYLPGATANYSPPPLLLNVTDPAGNSTQYIYVTGQDASLNFKLAAINYADGTCKQFTYDRQARLIQKTGAWGADPIAFSYSANGTAITDAVGASTVIQVDQYGNIVSRLDPNGGLTLRTYDGARNLTQLTDPLGNKDLFSYNEYGDCIQSADALGNVVQSGYNLTFHKPTYITDALENTTTFRYDSTGNLMRVSHPDGMRDSYLYDGVGNRTSSVDALGNITAYGYDSQGLLTSTLDPLGNTTVLGYTKAGDLNSVVNPLGFGLTFNRDTLGRVTTRVYADGSHEDYSYNGTGKVVSSVNRRGQQMNCTYNVAGRLATKTYPSGRSYIYSYDSRGVLDNVVKQAAGVGTLDVAYEHDLGRRLTKVKVPGKTTPQTYDISYAYDVAGNRTLLAYPDGYIVHYSYDAAGRLLRIADKNDATIATFAYDAAGRRTGRSLGNGTSTVYQYDVNNRVSLLRNLSPGSAVQTSFTYTRNHDGIPTSIVTAAGANNFLYDGDLQLTNVVYSSGTTVTLSYDAAGNRSNVTNNGVGTNYTANSLNEYTEVGGTTIGYDASGNETSYGVGTNATAYNWDEEDRLQSVNLAGTSVFYGYDFMGRLASKMVGGTLTRYIWDGDRICMQIDGDGHLVRRFVYGAGDGDLVLVQAGGSNYWTQQDALNSIVAVTDDSGGIVGQCTYDVYGNVLGGDLGGVPYGFAGLMWDSDASLYLARWRWYDPRLGRFVQPDPANLMGGMNLYAYADNNPVFFVDPSGLAIGGWAGGSIVGESFGYAGSASGPAGGPRPPAGSTSGPAGGPRPPAGSTSGPAGGPAGYSGTVDSGPLGDAAGGAGSITPLDGGPAGGASSVEGSGAGYEVAMAKPSAWTSGGICPTFIQLSRAQTELGMSAGANDILHERVLSAKIDVPVKGSLLRADIPICGVACGSEFKSYRVEFGEGSHPSDWHVIASSTEQQTKDPYGTSESLFMQGDLDLHGNLATWNTGLKEWVHLPWHPPEDNTDYSGVYTIRLVVEGNDGKTVEDRVTCEVGGIIAQCRQGVVASPDKRVTLRFPEQALLESFRVYSILSVAEAGEELPHSPTDATILGKVYRIREPGDRFIKDVVLEFTADAPALNGQETKRVGIACYDVEKMSWIWLPTQRNSTGAAFSAILKELPVGRAIYALVADKAVDRSSVTVPKSEDLPAAEAQPGILINDSFKNDFGTFKPRDRFVGATLSRDNQVTPDASYCLKLVNDNFGGDFSSTVLDRPFDVRKYPVLSFDYRIPPNVKIDWFLRVRDRWFNLRFTGDPIDFRNKDVNIVNLGAIDGIIADDKWHTAGVDLLHLLRDQTRYSQIDEIAMGDWHVGGYMKLEFGTNPRGATYYLSNVKLLGVGAVSDDPPVLLIDHFDKPNTLNALGGKTGCYCTPGSRCFEIALVDLPPSGRQAVVAGSTRVRAMQMRFDMTMTDAFGGYWTSLQRRNISAYSTIRFRLDCNGGVPPIEVGLRTTSGVEDKVLIAPYASEADRDGWREFQVPVRALKKLDGLGSIDVLFLSASRSIGSGKSEVMLSDLRLDQRDRAEMTTFESLSKTDFETQFAGNSTGAAAISTSLMPDIKFGGNQQNTVCRVSFGGTIGKDFGSRGGFSYAIWQCPLNGIDGRFFQYLSFKIRGERGGESPNFYLSDGGRRVCLRGKETKPVTADWQEIRLPLAFFEGKGIDLSHIDSLQLAFEWTEQSGTVYLDDIRFGPDSSGNSVAAENLEAGHR